MPEAYPVRWDDSNWGDKVGGQLRAALQARQQKQLQEAALARAAEQEQYERAEQAKDRLRQEAADKWQAERNKLDVEAAKMREKEHKLTMFEKEAKLRLEAAAQTPKPTFEQSQSAEVGPGKAPMMTPDTPEERAAFAAAPPEQVTIPADVAPSGQAINMPVRYQEDVRAEEARKQAQAIALYEAKQKAELANSESVAAAAARAAAAAAAAANKPAPAPKPSTGAEKAALGYYQRGKSALEDAEQFENKVAKTGLMGQARLQWAPNMMQTKEQQLYRQAQRSFTEARLRKESGAAIPPAEYENDSKTYFAQPGDDPEVIDRKRLRRAGVLESLRTGAGKAYAEYTGEDAPTAANAPKAESTVIKYDAKGNRIQ